MLAFRAGHLRTAAAGATTLRPSPSPLLLRRPLLRGNCTASGGPLRRTPPRLAVADDPNFEKYSEIDNATLSRVQNIRGGAGVPDEWIATEKVHGANFGIYVMGGGAVVRFAKRSGFVGDGETFFGYKAIVPELQKHGLAVHKLASEALRQPLDTVIINGELFGGKYLHPGVKRSDQSFMHHGSTRGISSVQREAFPQYSPDLHFYAFDLKVRHSESSPPRMLTFDEATAIFEKVPGLLYQRPLIRGPLEKIVAFNVEDFTTTVPALIGMGNSYLLNNRAEGIVARHCRRGQPEMEGKTTMLKIKSTYFSEIHMRTVVKDPMADARKMAIDRVGPQLPAAAGVMPTSDDTARCQHLVDHVTDVRLANVLSKLGPDPITSGEVTVDRLGYLLGQDALKDYLKDGEPEAVAAPLLVRREMVRYVLDAAKRLVAEKWAGIVKDAQADGGTE